jgi:hypothetical protein
MIEVSKNPSSAFTGHPRGPHFILTTHELLRENAAGEEVYELPLQKIVDYLDQHPGDKDCIEAMNLITCNNGMALLHHKLPNEKNVALLFAPNGPLVHMSEKGDFLDMNLERLAVVLVRNPYPDVKKHIADFISSVGLTPNLERLEAEFCATCGGGK